VQSLSYAGVEAEHPMAQKPGEMGVDDIATMMGNAGAGSQTHTQMLAELTRRQTVAQIDAAKYMLWSVIAIAITSGLNALFAFLTWYVPHSQ
jgi:hypothetical protein